MRRRRALVGTRRARRRPVPPRWVTVVPTPGRSTRRPGMSDLRRVVPDGPRSRRERVRRSPTRRRGPRHPVEGAARLRAARSGLGCSTPARCPASPPRRAGRRLRPAGRILARPAPRGRRSRARGRPRAGVGASCTPPEGTPAAAREASCPRAAEGAAAAAQPRARSARRPSRRPADPVDRPSSPPAPPPHRTGTGRTGAPFRFTVPHRPAPGHPESGCVRPPGRMLTSMARGVHYAGRSVIPPGPTHWANRRKGTDRARCSRWPGRRCWWRWPAGSAMARSSPAETASAMAWPAEWSPAAS